MPTKTNENENRVKQETENGTAYQKWRIEYFYDSPKKGIKSRALNLFSLLRVYFDFFLIFSAHLMASDLI